MGLPGASDGGSLLLEIGGSGVDQGRVGGREHHHQVGLGLRIVFMYDDAILHQKWQKMWEIQISTT